MSNMRTDTSYLTWVHTSVFPYFPTGNHFVPWPSVFAYFPTENHFVPWPPTDTSHTLLYIVIIFCCKLHLSSSLHMGKWCPLCRACSPVLFFFQFILYICIPSRSHFHTPPVSFSVHSQYKLYTEPNGRHILKTSFSMN